MKTAFALAALVGYAAAECPNACSGHGTCGAKDSCSCYQNYQGNDCSERTCYFGLAHVDSPKGDLNADGMISGPLTTVITGSEVYPWGTTEQFPNANSNEGHFYMECSNKGICDRKTGTCDCFDGYTGTACARAACPNDCSGHGTCESIKELAEMRSFDTTAHHATGSRAANSNNGQDYNAAVEESYSYDLWDADKTMGCKCDPVYYGADCSLKKCKYGVDPLFYDSTDGAIHQTTVVHLGSVGGCTAATCAATNRRYPADITGTFKLVFYDVFGEKYVTKDISAVEGTVTPKDIRMALEALPNGVISAENTDVTGTPPAAVTVSMQNKAGDITTSGGIGAGQTNAAGTAVGAGLGTASTQGTSATAANGVSAGPEFTVTFSSNPGILKAIEVDTRNIGNTGVADYWVANSRQGQFNSRYTTNLGRVNTLLYGSTKLFTNTDLTSSVVGNTGTNAASLIKVGGQEFQVVAEKSNFLTLSEPFLGSSITATLTATGAELGGSGPAYAQHGTIACAAGCATDFSAATDTLTVTANFGAITGWVKITSAATNIGITGGVAQKTCQAQILSVASATSVVLAPGHNCVTFASLTDGLVDIAQGHFVPQVTGGSDEAAKIAVVGVDNDIVVAHLQSGAALSVGGCSFSVSAMGTAGTTEVALYGNAIGAGGGALGANNDFDCNPQNGQGPAVTTGNHVYSGEFAVAGTPVYRRTDDPNNQNIYKAPSDTGTQLTSNLMLTRGSAAAYLVDSTSLGYVQSFDDTTGGSEAFTIATGGSAAAVAQDEVFFVNGRGPMVEKTGIAAAGTALSVKTHATNGAKYFPRVVAAVTTLINWPAMRGIAADADTGLTAGSVLLLDGRRYRVRARGAGAGIDGRAKVTLAENYAGGSLEKVCDACIAVSVGATPIIKTFGATGGAGEQLSLVTGDRILQADYIHEDFLTTVKSITGGNQVTTSVGGSIGTATSQSQTTDVTATAESGGKAMYKTRYGALGAPAVTQVAETATGANTYNYVAQCANRGTCDAATGICKCFKGYAGDNCAKQNMLAM